jgi:twitching motility protein PilT
MINLEKYFKITIEKRASDLHLVEGSIPSLRISGNLMPIEKEILPVGELSSAINRFLDSELKEKLKRKKDIDVSLKFDGINFRVNIHHQEGRLGLSARLVVKDIPSPKDINLDKTIYDLSKLRDGLILVTGPAGAGKSTTLAVIVDLINQERASHIITIEDPIEYHFEDKQSIVEQRQLGRDTSSFASALKYALRQDPNVLMVGEIRDSDTVAAVLSAAKTGHLVLSTLHTSSAAETIERLVDFYPVEFHEQICHQLASLLRAVISQQLIPKIGGGMICAREILINNNASANIIRSQHFEQLDMVIQTNRAQGMITMNDYVEQLFKSGLINESVARNRERNLDSKSIYY